MLNAAKTALARWLTLERRLQPQPFVCALQQSPGAESSGLKARAGDGLDIDRALSSPMIGAHKALVH
jgi:hypothetical protein